MLATLILTHTF